MILFCECSYADVLPAGTKRDVLAELRRSGVDLVAVPDLCELAARRDPVLKALAASGDLKIVACYPRAVRWLFHAAGAPDLPANVEVLNMRRENAAAILAKLSADRGLPASPGGRNPGAESGSNPEGSGDWVPWFPVIDYSRCRNCKQCLSFCLFGVYAGSGDGKVEVVNPRNCKTNCPACARICPEVAILFPKYGDAPINGAEINDEEAVRAKVKVNVREILGDDPYAALAARRMRAKGKRLLKPDVNRALAEREAHSGNNG